MLTTSARTRWAIIGAGLVLFAFVFLVTRRYEGYLSPVFSPDGEWVYYVSRSTNGVVLGLGFEHFTPPAKVLILRDRFELRRVRFSGGSPEVIHRWDASPLERRWISTYRGRIFSTASALLRWNNGELAAKIALREPTQPTATNHFISRDRPAWRTIWESVSAPADFVLRDNWELIAAPGPEGTPCAVVALSRDNTQVRVLAKSGSCDTSPERLAGMSRRESIERSKKIEETQRTLVARFKAEGRSEVDAILRANREMERLGYFPRTPKLIARLLSAGESPGDPLFKIAAEEFQVGLFPDIEQAMAKPGEEIEKSMGKYIIHNDFDTSRRINDFLEKGGLVFFVESNGKRFELKVER